MKRFVILAALLVCQQAQADTYILVFDSYPSKEAQQVKALLLRRVKPPIHCHYVPYARATKAAFARNMRWLKTKAKKGDTVIIYVSSHGCPGDGNLLISATHGPDVPSSLIRKTTETLPCPCLVLIDACFAGSALHEPWRKTTVVCAANDHEVSWTGGMSKAVCQELRQPRQWTMQQMAVDLMRRIPACSRSQHPMAFIGECNALLTQRNTLVDMGTQDRICPQRSGQEACLHQPGSGRGGRKSGVGFGSWSGAKRPLLRSSGRKSQGYARLVRDCATLRT